MTQPISTARCARVLLRFAAVLACFGIALATTSVAQAAPAYTPYLDLPAVNGDGSGGGGLNPALPLDIPTLRAAVEQARAAGIPPRRYATLLHQYWLVVATTNAGIDLAAWDPAQGVAANSRTFIQVYENYRRLTLQRPDFYWAGLAELAGGSFASGFLDMTDIGGLLGIPGIHQLGAAVADRLRGLPPEVLDRLPSDLRLLGSEGERLTPEDLTWYQTRLMIMQKHIFLDQVPMHEAYLAEGLPAIEEMHRAGILDENAVAAWHSIASGTAAGFDDALLRMTDREQNQIIADQWDVTAAGRGVLGRVLTYVSTLAGKPAVPAVRAPGVFAPIAFTAQVGGRSLTLDVPLPNFNWADRDTRWTYITGDLLPRYTDLQADPPGARAVLSEPFAAKLAAGRLLRRLPDLVADLTGHWQLTD
ncbi:hypothetical protein GZH49_09165 [Nocardia terpenica]|uniref:hypothetical protein n=1 Tax=Nocardia terpenica TaxID=455432 RepID=UPI002FE1D65A